MNQPNDQGLVPVYLLQAFGKNFPKTVAGFPADLAAALVEKGIAQWDLDGVATAPAEPAEAEAKAKPKRAPKADATEGPVAIPEDWQAMHVLSQIRLAKQIAGSDATLTKEGAIQIITAEVARRANPEGVN